MFVSLFSILLVPLEVLCLVSSFIAPFHPPSHHRSAMVLPMIQFGVEQWTLQLGKYTVLI